MFEMTRNDQELFERFQQERKAYRDGVYDFTFDNAFIIYHVNLVHENTYIALNIKKGTGVRMTSTKNKIYKPEGYRKLIPYVLSAIRYTGDPKYFYCSADKIEVIERY